MNALDSVLALRPASDAEQERLLRERYGLRSLGDLDGLTIFGAAALGESLAGTFRERGIRVAGFSDNDEKRWGKSHAGLPILPPWEIDRDRPIVIASKYVKEIDAGLRERGMDRPIPHYLLPVLFPEAFTEGYHFLSADAIGAARRDIREVYAILGDDPSRQLYLRLLRFRITLDPQDLPDPEPDQYFPGDLWPISPDETYVDVGACGGDTLLDFLQRSGGVFAKYFAVEPDPQNIEALKRAIPPGAEDKIILIPYGAGERRHRVAFASGKGGESKISGDGPATVEIVSLDELFSKEPVSTVKIDVEGYEREVLRGATRLIAERSPKIAVAVYHKLPDLWEIPLWIKRHNPRYRHFLRHHTPEIYDTVLYCLPGPAGR